MQAKFRISGKWVEQHKNVSPCNNTLKQNYYIAYVNIRMLYNLNIFEVFISIEFLQMKDFNSGNNRNLSGFFSVRQYKYKGKVYRRKKRLFFFAVFSVYKIPPPPKKTQTNKQTTTTNA